MSQRSCAEVWSVDQTGAIKISACISAPRPIDSAREKALYPSKQVPKVSTNRTEALQISRRYATAAFDLSVEAKKEQTLVSELTTLAQAIDASAELAEALGNPLVTNTEKSAVLAALVKSADGLTQRTVKTIAEGGRASLIPVIAEQLRALLAKHSGEVEAVVTSARALSAATQKQLAQALATATGKKVQLTLKQDPQLLGGLTVELGSLRLDATLAGALTNMRAQLLATTH